MGLRPYQQKALDEIRAHYAAGRKKVLLHLATGGGKTTVFGEVLKGAHQKQVPGLLIVRGRKLVDQASKRLFRESVPHGVTMAGHWNDRPAEPIQLCSIDTLLSRMKRGIAPPPGRVIVWDEAHLSLTAGALELARIYADAFHLPVTATPYVTKPMRHFADYVVKPTTTQELIDDGYLVDAEYWIPPRSQADLTNVRSQGGDYVVEDLDKIMGETQLVGDVVSEWLNIAPGKKSLYFFPSIETSELYAAAFRARGVRAVHCDAETKEDKREEYIAALEAGELDVICNMGIFCTGVDIPSLEVVGMCRPTESYPLYLQQAGRGTRPFPGKPHFLLIDHARNVKKHGKITEEVEYSLDGKIKKFLTSQQVQSCEDCFKGFYGNVCPYCAKEVAAKDRVREVVQVEGQLVRLEKESELEYFLRQTKRTRKMRGYKQAWVYHEVSRRFGEEVAQQVCPTSKYFRK